MASKKSRRGGMKPRARKRMRRAEDGKHYKIPGFDAFSPHIIPVKKLGKGKKPKLVPCEEIVEPEKGIHSLAWAASIVPQTTGFLKLPFEVRVKIYEHIIDDFSCGEEPIEPRKKGNKFWSPSWASIAEETTKFSQLSRQVYVDFVGSSLLYRFKRFSFSSGGLLLNYLCVINPVHKNAIRSITLNINFRPNCTTLPNKAITYLSQCASLEDLRIRIHLPTELCRFSPTFIRPPNLKTYRVTMDLPMDRKIEKKVRECVTQGSLRGLKGLKRFELIFCEPAAVYIPGLIVNYRFVRPVAEPSEELTAFVEEMRGLMVGGKGK
ncbi:hypothetical protein DL95DRAFT_441999 [Leptodontidium sp. 2 PMI_412]|nr:hypothetical protein BKA61DRAFT_115352 [Leptodontidium sp. MPI-SDFR-AT-0119]KAH9221667.1 hypothetical protein DL95DRAFT_441999 [Leptodontidium sp. 2 PMI_412]